MLVLVLVVSDNASSNTRNRYHIAAMLGATPNMLYPPGACACHKFSRVTSRALREETVVGDVYGVQYLGLITNHAESLAKAAWVFITTRMAIVDDVALPPLREDL